MLTLCAEADCANWLRRWLLVNIIMENGRFPSTTFIFHQRPFPPNIASFLKTYNSRRRFTSTAFVLPGGRSLSQTCAAPNNFHNQPAAQNPKPLPQSGWALPGFVVLPQLSCSGWAKYART
jgi:hypothetical protein